MFFNVTDTDSNTQSIPNNTKSQCYSKNILLPPSELMSKVSVYTLQLFSIYNLLLIFSSNLFIKLFINLLINSV